MGFGFFTLTQDRRYRSRFFKGVGVTFNDEFVYERWWNKSLKTKVLHKSVPFLQLPNSSSEKVILPPPSPTHQEMLKILDTYCSGYVQSREKSKGEKNLLQKNIYRSDSWNSTIIGPNPVESVKLSQFLVYVDQIVTRFQQKYVTIFVKIQTISNSNFSAWHWTSSVKICLLVVFNYNLKNSFALIKLFILSPSQLRRMLSPWTVKSEWI